MSGDWSAERSDALEGLATLEACSVTALVTDPPYCSGGFKEVERARGSAMISDDGVAKLGWFSALESSGLRNRNLLIWEKESPGMGQGFRPMHECILHLTKGTGRYRYLDTGNVIKVRRVPQAQREHPTEKPEALMRAIVRPIAGPGDLVVDPFMGSGKTGVAALKLGCRFKGFERDPRFVALARDNLAAAGQQGVLPC